MRDRKEYRYNVNADVILRQDTSLPTSISLVDLSRHGCKIAIHFPLRLSERILLRIPGLEAIAAYVCWIEGFVAGVEFERPLHPAVLEHLLSSLPNEHAA